MSTGRPGDPGHTARRDALWVLARASAAELGPIAVHLDAREARDLRGPEMGLVMVRGRVGGDGAPFNLGEATVSRAVVVTRKGLRGHGQRLGRDLAAARLAAIADALWQDEATRAFVERDVIAPVRDRLKREAALAAARTAATRVDFFTLVRGDSE